ncbi:MAG: hypothetical protein LHV68_12820 [Elusimicrobia bacterium]|nr:hypothetical protein [Candidatus Liberimonas magnetica]
MCKPKDGDSKTPEIRKKGGYQPITEGYQPIVAEKPITLIPEGGSGESSSDNSGAGSDTTTNSEANNTSKDKKK